MVVTVVGNNVLVGRINLLIKNERFTTENEISSESQIH